MSTVSLCPLFLCVHCSYASTVPLYVHCWSVFTVPLCVLFLCVHCFSVFTVLLCPLFLCVQGSSSSTISLFPLSLIVAVSLPTVSLCPLSVCAHCSSVVTVHLHVPTVSLCSLFILMINYFISLHKETARNFKPFVAPVPAIAPRFLGVLNIKKLGISFVKILKWRPCLSSKSILSVF